MLFCSIFRFVLKIEQKYFKSLDFKGKYFQFLSFYNFFNLSLIWIIKTP